jgi:hypothetical protein
MVIVWHAKVIGRHTVVIGLHTLFIWVARLGHLTLEVTCGNLRYYAKNNLNLSYYAKNNINLSYYSKNNINLSYYSTRPVLACQFWGKCKVLGKLYKTENPTM